MDSVKRKLNCIISQNTLLIVFTVIHHLFVWNHLRKNK